MPIGRVIDAWRWLSDPYGFLDRAVALHGLTFRARLPTHGEPLVTGDPELIREIVRCPELDGGAGVAALREAFGGDSLISLDGETHDKRRRLVAPWLREPNLERHDSITLEATCAAVDELTDGQPFSAYALVRRISLRVIVRVVFGDLPDADARAVETLTAAFLESFSSPLVLFLRGLHVRLGPWGRALRRREALTRRLREHVRAAHANGGADGLLAALLPELTDDEIVAEVLALLLFGHDTGAATLSWAMAHLAERPDVQERLAEEARVPRIRGRSDQGLTPLATTCRPGGTPESAARRATDSCQGREPLVSACLLESMRLCPVVVHLTRVATADVELAGHRLAAGERVLPSAYVAQRNPAIFPEPERFDPERFLDRPPPRHAYFPFGFGTRTCVGEPFVRRQMTLILGILARTIAFSPAPGTRFRPVRHLVLVIPEGGARLVARKRS